MRSLRIFAVFSGLATLVWRRPRYLVLAQGLGSLGLSLYFVASVSYLLLVADTLSVYGAASLTYWLVAAHLLIYVTWPLWRALALSLTPTVLTVLPAVVVTHHDCLADAGNSQHRGAHRQLGRRRSQSAQPRRL